MNTSLPHAESRRKKAGRFFLGLRSNNFHRPGTLWQVAVLLPATPQRPAPSGYWQSGMCGKHETGVRACADYTRPQRLPVYRTAALPWFHRPFHQGFIASLKMMREPIHAGGLVHLTEGPPHRFCAYNPIHAKQTVVDIIRSDRSDMAISMVTSQNRQQHRAEHIALRWCVVAVIRERRIIDLGIEQSSGLQIFRRKTLTVRKG